MKYEDHYASTFGGYRNPMIPNYSTKQINEKIGCRKPFAQLRRQHDEEGACCFQMNNSYCSKVIKRGLIRTPIDFYETLTKPRIKAI